MRAALIAALAAKLPKPLAVELIDDFLQMRTDASTRVLGRAAPGKFVESVAQALQHLDAGKHDARPDVDKTLRTIEQAGHLDEGLRICAARIARAMYALRNKRSIAHKNDVDPNSYDLQFLLHGGQWILAEFVRTCSGLSMEEAGRLIDAVQAPVGGIVEDFGDKQVVLSDLSALKEILVLLHSRYPDAIPRDQIVRSLDRKNVKTVRNAIRQLWREKLVEEIGEDQYRLTQRGVPRAADVVRQLVEGPAV